MTRSCGCTGPGVVVDEERHARWHELVVAQGGPAGDVTLETLLRARGITRLPLGDPLAMPTADELQARRDRVTRKRWR